MQFFAYGHSNIKATHPTTLEFTKDPEVSFRGDCIVGVKANFNTYALRNFLHLKKIIRIKLSAGNIHDEFTAEINPDFNDDKEMVIRKSTYLSKRTLGIKSSKSALDLVDPLRFALKNQDQKILVEFY